MGRGGIEGPRGKGGRGRRREGFFQAVHFKPAREKRVPCTKAHACDCLLSDRFSEVQGCLPSE